MTQQLFKHNAAERVIAAEMPPERASMHLDTILTCSDRDLVTIYEPVANNIRPISYRPGHGEGTLDEVRRGIMWPSIVVSTGHCVGTSLPCTEV